MAATPVPTLVYAANAISSTWNVETGAATFACAGGETLVFYWNGVANADQGLLNLLTPSGVSVTLGRVSGAFSNWFSSGSTYSGFALYVNAAPGYYTIKPPTVAGGSDGIIRITKVVGVPQTLASALRTVGVAQQTTSSKTITVTTSGSAQIGDLAIGGRCHENSVGSTDTITPPSGWTSDVQYLNGSVNIPTDYSHFIVTASGVLSGTWTSVDNAIVDTSAEIIVLAANPTAMVFTSQPTNTSATAKGFAAFTVGVSGASGSPTYQWSVNGVNVGTSSSTLVYQPGAGETLSTVLCTVTDGTGGSIITNPAYLRVHKATAAQVKKRPLVSLDNSGVKILPNLLFTDALFDPSNIAPYTGGGGGSVNAGLTATEGPDTASATTAVTLTANLTATEAADTLAAATGVLVQDTLTTTEAADTISSTAAVSVTASLTATEAADTVTTALSVLVQATETSTEAADTVGSTTSALLQASLTATEGPDTLSSTAGAGGINATLTATESADSLTATTAVVLAASSSITESADTTSSTTAVLVRATAGITEAADGVSSTGLVALAATLAAFEASDSTSSAASVSVTASLTATEASDTLSATAGALAAVANLTVTEASDTGSSALAVSVQTAFTATETADTGASSGSVRVGASASILEASDGLAGASAVAVVATLAASEAADTLSANSSGPGVQASLTATEGSDTLSFLAAVRVAGDALVTESSDTASAATTVVVGAVTVAQEAPDGVASSGVVAVNTTATLNEGADTASNSFGVAVMASLNVTEHPDSITSFIQTVVDQALIYIDPGLQDYTNGDLTYTDRSLIFGT